MDAEGECRGKKPEKEVMKEVILTETSSSSLLLSPPLSITHTRTHTFTHAYISVTLNIHTPHCQRTFSVKVMLIEKSIYKTFPPLVWNVGSCIFSLRSVGLVCPSHPHCLCAFPFFVSIDCLQDHTVDILQHPDKPPVHRLWDFVVTVKERSDYTKITVAMKQLKHLVKGLGSIAKSICSILHEDPAFGCQWVLTMDGNFEL